MSIFSASRISIQAKNTDDRSIRIGLINNMPDQALAQTEHQFRDILRRAAPDLALRVSFYSLPGIRRGDAGQRHLLANGYREFSPYEPHHLDGLIVTGTEPICADLRDEPYWDSLAQLYDWIAHKGPSTIFSCLAAHAAVLHYDGIERERLPEKRFGLFDHVVIEDHALTELLPPVARVAHSRWNDVSAQTLESNGYRILTQGSEAGVDMFVRDERKLLIFFQGHPEYDLHTLYREYRRDVRRFLTGERVTYPAMPRNYFTEDERALLTEFQSRATAVREDALMDNFPLAGSQFLPGDAWQKPAIAVMGAWLGQFAKSKRAQRPTRVREPGIEAISQGGA